MNRIGIITSGGDCGGLNAVIHGAARMAEHYGISSVVIPNGYAGLYNLVDFEEGSLTEMNSSRLRDVSVTLAGSEAGHSRVKISKIDDPHKYERIREGLKKHGIDALVVSGGDDTGSVVVDLTENGIPVNHAPKTMDLDLMTYSVGGDSTIGRLQRFISDLKTTGQSHNRIIVVETFGRYVGQTALKGGVAGGADCILIPEIAPDFDIVYEHLFNRFTSRVLESDVKAGTYMIVTAEALRGDPSKDDVNEKGFLIDPSKGRDAHGHYKLAGAGERVASELSVRMNMDERIPEFMKEAGLYIEGQYTKPEIRVIKPTHLLRCGDSSAYDVNFGLKAGAGAVILLLEGITGMTVAGIENNEVKYLPTAEAIKQNTVSLDEVPIYEAMGITFGRNPEEFRPKLVQVPPSEARHY
ncbi:6-phosphofructokinase [Candidatus Woesearchaeota archaeon]|nr:MAG: 6-phosphofructokinase [Candidatus Woesearchaeota archaeon]